MKEGLFSFLNENPALINQCPVCGQKFGQLQARVLLEADSGYLVHVSCQRCSAQILAVVHLGNLGASSVGMVTDLTANDVVKFRRLSPVSADEILELHQTLGREKVITDKF